LGAYLPWTRCIDCILFVDYEQCHIDTICAAAASHPSVHRQPEKLSASPFAMIVNNFNYRGTSFDYSVTSITPGQASDDYFNYVHLID
jgi:hypothetical protein